MSSIYIGNYFINYKPILLNYAVVVVVVVVAAAAVAVVVAIRKDMNQCRLINNHVILI